MPGRARAALVFRVGFADESLPRHGLSHLVEHLALSGLGHTSFEFNGMVDETKTMFVAAGSRAEVTEFVSAVARSLSSLPLDRLEAEKRILQVESANRSWSSINVLRNWRFGARGPGVRAYEEYALRWVTPHGVNAWVQHAFTRANAALVLSCPPPADLSLDLPDGAALPRPDGAPTPYGRAGYVTAGRSGLALSLMVPRSVASIASEWVLRRRLYDRLRVRDAVSYSVDVQRMGVDSTTNELVVLVDGLPESQAQIESGVLEVIEQLADAGCTEGELSEWQAKRRNHASEPDGIVSQLISDAVDDLYGVMRPATASARRIADVVAPRAVQEIVVDARHTAIFCVPSDSTVVADRLEPLPPLSDTAVSGTRYKSRNPNSLATLVVGDAGLTVALDAEQRATVLWGDCAAALAWDDGGRRLIGNDGITIDVQPQAWQQMPAIQSAIDAHTPAAHRIDMGEAPERPPAPLPRSMVIGTSSTGLVVVLGSVLVATAALLGAAGLRFFLILGVPCLALAAFCAREVCLRQKGRRAAGPGARSTAARPLRHLSRQRLWLTLVVSLAFVFGLVAASNAGTNVGPLPVPFGFLGLYTLRELIRRPSSSGRRRS